jgi:hypothetical protein
MGCVIPIITLTDLIRDSELDNELDSVVKVKHCVRRNGESNDFLM